MADTPVDLTPVSHEVEGRILTGVGASPDQLETVMERHYPSADPAGEPASTEAAPAVTPEQVQSPAQPQPQKTRGQKRFDELTREREEAKREAAALREQLQALQQQRQPSRPEPRPEPPKAAQTRQKPTADQIGARYQSYDDYVEDLADWKAEQRLAALDVDAHVRKSIEADRASRDFMSTLATVGDRGRASYPDFNQVLQTGPGVTIDLGPTPQAGEERQQMITRLPYAEHVFYAIAKDAQLAHAIQRSTDVQFGMWLASLAPQQAAASHPASTAPAGSPTVPAPYQPVGNGRASAAVPSSELPKRAGYDFDASGYREKRAKERGLRR